MLLFVGTCSGRISKVIRTVRGIIRLVFAQRRHLEHPRFFLSTVRESAFGTHVARAPQEGREARCTWDPVRPRLWSIPTPLGLATPAPTTLAPSPSCCKPGRRRRLGAHDAIASRARPTRQMKLPAVGASSPSDGRWSRASWSSAGSLLRIVSRPKLEPALHCRRAECRCQQGAERDHAARSQREWSDMIAA